MIDYEHLSVAEMGELLYELDKDHYEQKPVDIETFLLDPYYLGNYWRKKSGEIEYFPFWLKHMKKIHVTPLYSPVYEVLVSLPIGSGKSVNSLASICYEIYKLQCLKNPTAYYGLPPGTFIVFALFSASMSLATDVNWNYLKNMMEVSPWFQRYCPLPEQGKLKSEDEVKLFKDVSIDLGSSSIHALGKAVFGGILDEANFQKTKSAQAGENYNVLRRRMESRFKELGDRIPGKLYMVSSPNKTTDFLTVRLQQTQDSIKTYRIEDTPIWEIQPHRSNSSRTFTVFLGDDTFDPCIVEPEDKRKFDPNLLMFVPEDYRKSFTDDLLSAIKDLGGRESSASTALFRHIPPITICSTVPHRFSQETMVLDFYDKENKIANYADMAYFQNPMFPGARRVIHMDLGVTNDKLGIGCVFSRDEVEQEFQNTKLVRSVERYFIQDWCLSVRCKPGQQIPFYKIREFILLLKTLKYPIGLITADQFQSTDMRQLLALEGYDTAHCSVDGEKGRLAYLSFRDAVYRQRILLTKHTLLQTEMREIRDDGFRVDHPAHCSKDLLDGTVGAYWGAFNHPEFSSNPLMLSDSKNPEITPAFLKEAQEKSRSDGVARMLGYIS